MMAALLLQARRILFFRKGLRFLVKSANLRNLWMKSVRFLVAALRPRYDILRIKPREAKIPFSETRTR